MKLKIGAREVESGTKYLGPPLRDCNALMSDGDALRARMDEDGYLLVRGLHPREQVLTARRRVVEHMQNELATIKPDTDPMTAVIGPGQGDVAMMGKRQITHDRDVLAVLESQAVFDFFETLFGEPARTLDYKWLRAIGTESFTGAHYDFVYLGRGSQRLHSCWTPLGDLPAEQGGLALCIGSHKLEGFAKVRDTYGKMDVDRDKVRGFFSNDPIEIVDQFGGQWQTTDFEAGDVLFFGLHTMHMSLVNRTDRYRISCDTRFQPESDPVDERWIGEKPKAHYAWLKGKGVEMDEARKQWGV
jgi:ectoine hydroxylase-related dioxygenase (phytanoyl-CoA dioxygenase family)